MASSAGVLKSSTRANRKRVVDNIAQPPPPPDFPRRFRVTPLQAVGIPLLLLLPALHLLGVLDAATTRAAFTNGEWQVEYELTTRQRYQKPVHLRLHLTNLAPAIRALTVVVDSAYLSQFVEVRATPPLDHHGATPVLEIAGGATAVVRLDLTPAMPGWVGGEVAFRGDGIDRAIRLRSFILP
ncbi:MAG TPA: hypothetical protein VNZ57_12070 [Longimicrobiales bacterium]|nr:hypothetical protein [Longimicrobiales bacterium]